MPPQPARQHQWSSLAVPSGSQGWGSHNSSEEEVRKVSSSPSACLFPIWGAFLLDRRGQGRKCLYLWFLKNINCKMVALWIFFLPSNKQAGEHDKIGSIHTAVNRVAREAFSPIWKSFCGSASLSTPMPRAACAGLCHPAVVAGHWLQVSSPLQRGSVFLGQTRAWPRSRGLVCSKSCLPCWVTQLAMQHTRALEEVVGIWG